MILYEFKDCFKVGASERTVCIGQLAAVTETVTKEELQKSFGGWIIYSDLQNVEYLGVWGVRKTQSLRSILRSRGTEILLQRFRPADIQIRIRYAVPGEVGASY